MASLMGVDHFGHSNSVGLAPRSYPVLGTIVMDALGYNRATIGAT